MMVYPRLTDARPLEGFRLLLTFDDHEKRIYDFSPNLSHKYYQQLSDWALFAKVSVQDGDIEWETGQDFCPHTLYEDSSLIDE